MYIQQRIKNLRRSVLFLLIVPLIVSFFSITPKTVEASTSNFAATTSGIYFLGYFGSVTNNMGHNFRQVLGVNSYVTTVVHGSSVTAQVFAGSYTATVDGGAPFTVTGTAGWTFQTIFTGLPDTYHTITLAGTYFENDNLFQVTGSAPAVSAPSGFGVDYVLRTTPYTTYGILEGSPVVATSNGYTPGFYSYATSSGAGLRFKATTTNIKLWLYQGLSPSKLVLYQDGVEITSATPANTSTFGLFTLASGLDGQSHEYKIIPVSEGSTFNVYSLMVDSLDSVAHTALPTYAYYGDSITDEAMLADTRSGDAYLVSSVLRDNVPRRVGVAGSLTSTYGRDNTANITGLSPQPTKVFVRYGTNDMSAGVNTTTFKNDYQTMLSNLLSGLPVGTKIYAEGIFPRTGFTTVRDTYNSKIQDAVTGVANARVQYVSTDGWIDISTDTTDGLHPNATGYGKIAVQEELLLDVTGPTVTVFSIPSTSGSLTVSISSFTATDNVGVTGYKLTESSTPPLAGDAGWTGSAPSSYTFASSGAKTLYAWTKDGSGNVSSSLNDSVTISSTHSLSYTAGPNGSLTGSTSQTVNDGADGTAVTAIPASHYHFVNWSDASTSNPRTDTVVTGDISVTANFEIDTYTLSYTAGSNGSLTGSTSQTVNYNASGSAVTAVPAAHYHFVNWSDASTSNPRTDSSVAANVSVTANFAIDTYNLSYTAGANGSLTGTASQTVNYGTDGTAVTAVPATGYHFVNWSDASTQNPRTDTNAAADVSVTANFAIDTYALSYSAGAHGSLTGTASQTVNYNASGSAVTAVPSSGYAFANWSDASTQNPRTDTNVTGDIVVTATFTVLPPLVVSSGGTNGSSGGVNYGCKDPNAINYSAFAASMPSLCKYATTTAITTPALGGGNTCTPSLILTQNLHAPSRNGVYNSYTKGIVKEAKILQLHLNRLGFSAGPVDGILGTKSDGAIKRMQTYLKTKSDGFVGPNTRALINTSCGTKAV